LADFGIIGKLVALRWGIALDFNILKFARVLALVRTPFGKFAALLDMLSRFER